MLATGPGERVVAGTAIVLRGPPLRANPTAGFETMQGGIERSLADPQDILGDLLYALSNAPAVHRSECQRFQDQDFERALDKVYGLRRHNPLPSTVDKNRCTPDAGGCQTR